MTCWYEGAGGGVVKACPEVTEILEEFREQYSGQHDDPVKVERGPESGTWLILIAWHDTYSNSTPTDLDNHLEKLKPYVHGELALSFDYQYDNEREQMYIGDPLQVARAMSARALHEVEQLKEKLLTDDKAKAIELLSG